MISKKYTSFNDFVLRKLDSASTILSKLFPDRIYINLKYKLRFRRELNIDSPKGFNEKLNWLKLNNRNPLYSIMVDKFFCKEYVANIIGPEYVVPVYGYWKNVDDIDYEILPERCFLKTTHDSSGGLLIDKKKGIDFKIVKKILKGRNRSSWYWHLREWPYKNVKPGIIAEEYLDEGTGKELCDYKFYCFNGEPKYMYITNKGKHIYENFYDMNFNPVDITHGFERKYPEYQIPDNFEKMKELASTLSKGHVFIRIDFFNVKGKLYFGEFTFYDWGGMKPLNEKWEQRLGDLINLDLIKS